MNALPLFGATFAVCSMLAPALRADAVFDPLVNRDVLWELTQENFQKATQGMPFDWTSDARDSIRAAGDDMTLFGLPLTEVVARFNDGKLTKIDATIYARGDAGELSEEKFDALVTQAVGAISKATRVKYSVRGKDPKNAVKAFGLVWESPRGFYTLKYSKIKEVKSRAIPFRAEFVRLEIEPPKKELGLLATAEKRRQAAFDGPQHVERDTTSGDVWIGSIPMVDQGEKGYCVVASIERVMRYYGTDVDSNELAQVANSSAEEGTSLDAMRDSMRKLTARLRVRVREVEKVGFREIRAMLKDYNRAAKRLGQREIPDPGDFIDVDALYRAMDAEVLKAARTHNKSDLERFHRDVKASIDKGIPLLWSVQLGLVSEKGVPQAGGSHMRLIIGYNEKTEEIIYSDSWGAGHEKKRMKADDAWTITISLMTVSPLS
ncbi:MAG: C39 family peptidase [Chthoniobacteraceae bacterium]